MIRVLSKDPCGMMQVHGVECLDIQQPRWRVEDLRVYRAKNEADLEIRAFQGNQGHGA
jgi:hypothetical protein